MSTATEENGVVVAQREGREEATAQRNTTNTWWAAWVKKTVRIVTVILLLKGAAMWVTEMWDSHEETVAAERALKQRQEVEKLQAIPRQRIAASPHEWSLPVRVFGHQCISWATPVADADDLDVQVRNVNDTTWYEWRDFLRLKATGQFPYEDVGLYRFKSKLTGPVVVSYVILARGQCT